MNIHEPSQKVRLHDAYHYDQRMRLRMPLPLWLGFALGMAHVLSQWTVVGFLLGPLGVMLADWRLFICDALQATVWVTAGFRTPKASARVRWLWRQGRAVLMTAHTLAVFGFLALYGKDLLRLDGDQLLLTLLMLTAHVALLVYLARSALVRDLFNDFPQPEDDHKVPVVPLPVQKRQRQAQALLAQCVAAMSQVPELADAGGRQALAALTAAPHDAEAWHALGLCWLALNQEALALQCVRLATDFDGGQAMFLQNLGELERRQGLLASAVAHGQSAVRMNPQNAHAHYNLAVALAQAGQWQAAVASYQTTVTLQPGHAPAWNNLGVLWQSQSDWARAREAYQNALRADPHHEQSRLNLQSLPDPAP